MNLVKSNLEKGKENPKKVRKRRTRTKTNFELERIEVLLQRSDSKGQYSEIRNTRSLIS